MKTTVVLIIPTLGVSHLHTLKKVIKSVLCSAKERKKIIVHILVVFNRGKKEKIKVAHAHTISFVENIGFTGAVNEGILYSKITWNPDWYIICNDDAYVKKNFIEEIESVWKTKKYDAVSCGVEDLQGNVESFGLQYFKTGLAFPQKIHGAPVPYLCGTCMALSKKIILSELHERGYVLHPLYFAYAEDLELSVRMYKSKRKIYIIPKLLIVHQGSQTAVRGSYFQLYYGFRNAMLTMCFHWSKKQLFLRFPWICIGQFYMIALSLWKGYWNLYPSILVYLLRNNKLIRYYRHIYAS